MKYKILTKSEKKELRKDGRTGGSDKKGMFVPDLAAKYGCSEATVIRTLRLYGTPINPRRASGKMRSQTVKRKPYNTKTRNFESILTGMEFAIDGNTDEDIGFRKGLSKAAEAYKKFVSK